MSIDSARWTNRVLLPAVVLAGAFAALSAGWIIATVILALFVIGVVAVAVAAVETVSDLESAEGGPEGTAPLPSPCEPGYG
jgi:hypothetical protein